MNPNNRIMTSRTTTKKRVDTPFSGFSTLNENLVKNIRENKVLKIGLYASGALVLLFLLGKASKIISVSVLEFKQLAVAIKHS